jgi:hypothetical protein
VFERERRDLFGNRKFQRATKALLGREVTVHVHESLSYVGTVTVDDGNAEEKLEAWLEEQGYRRNATAYLKYRMRDGRKEYEQGSWAYRKDVRADEQLHVRLFDGDAAGTVDVYAHREPSVTKGEEHYGTPSYREGVCAVRDDPGEWTGDTDGTRSRNVTNCRPARSPKRTTVRGSNG